MDAKLDFERALNKVRERKLQALSEYIDTLAENEEVPYQIYRDLCDILNFGTWDGRNESR